MNHLRCTTCNKPLTGGLDTYGTTEIPLCHKCFQDGLDVEVVRKWQEWLEETKPDDRQQKLDL